jgi:sugar/nucleoside kinase (ribokinase family)
MASDPVQVVVAGHICLDIIPDLSQVSVSAAQFFAPGELAEIGPATLSTGGAVPNTGLALIKLGLSTVLMGKVGDDPFGTLVRLILEPWGAGRGLVVVPGEATSYTVVLSPQGLDRMFLHDPAANTTFCADDIRYDVVAEARLFHLGYPPLLRRLYADEGRELVEIFRRVKELGVTTSLDVTMPDLNSPSGQADWRAILEGVMAYVDVFLPSVGEMLAMLDRARYDDYRRRSPEDILPLVTGGDLSRLGDALLGMGGGIVGVKCGERGFYLRTAGEGRLREIGQAKPSDLAAWANREMWQPAFRIADCAGATGAGDSAIAGFLAAYLRGCSPKRCLEYACAAGAFSVTASAALSGLRSWDETVAAVEAGWERNPLEVTGERWFESEDGLWLGPHDAGGLRGGM